MPENAQPEASPPTAPAPPPPPPEERRPRRRGIVGPLILIAAGIVLLLNNVGVLPWSVWGSLIRFWPVILILVGLDILIGRRSLVGSIAAALVSLVVIALVVILALAPFASTAGLVTERFAQPAGAATRGVITFSPGIDHLRVLGAGAPGTLVDAEIRRPEWENVEKDYRMVGDTAELTLRSAGAANAPFFGSPPINGGWDVRLDPAIPLDLNVNQGVGQAEIDLSGLMIETLAVHAGVGQTVLTLPGAGRITGRIEAGVGETRLVIPRSLGARLRVETGIGSVHVPNDYTRQGDVWVSPSSASTSTADLVIHGGVGSIDIEEKP